MNRLFFTLVISCLLTQAIAQPKPGPDKTEKADKAPDRPASPSRTLNIDSAVTTKAEVTIKGIRIPYEATAGTIPVWDEDGKPIAGVFYTYYERTDIKDKDSRPLVISFNGGPGTPSVWMEIGYTGPRRLNLDEEGYPIQPYGVKENNSSILDVADIVYIDPVNCGFSRPVSKDIPTSKFFGVNEDIKYLAEWIATFVSRKGRWASPKFLIGGKLRYDPRLRPGPRTAERPMDVPQRRDPRLPHGTGHRPQRICKELFALYHILRRHRLVSAKRFEPRSAKKGSH